MNISEEECQKILDNAETVRDAIADAYLAGYKALHEKLILKGCGWQDMAKDGRCTPIVWLNNYPVDGQRIYVIDGEPSTYDVNHVLILNKFKEEELKNVRS